MIMCTGKYDFNHTTHVATNLYTSAIWLIRNATVLCFIFFLAGLRKYDLHHGMGTDTWFMIQRIKTGSSYQ